MIVEQVPTTRLNEWYLDDGAVAGTKEELQRVVDIVSTHGPARGLNLSTSATTTSSKSTVWCPDSTRAAQLGPDPLHRGIPLVREEGIVLLGSPIGSIEFERQAILTRTEKVRGISDKLPLMADPQSEFILLPVLPLLAQDHVHSQNYQPHQSPGPLGEL